MIVGIVPAAGKAERFGGLLKELLPWDTGESLLHRTVRILWTVSDAVIVISNPDKIAQHAQELEGFSDVYFVLQDGDTLLSGIRSVTLEADYYFFAMPDTVFPENIFPDSPDLNFMMVGLFDTIEGHRYGVWRDGRIDDKNPENRGQLLKAWGVLGWPQSVMKILHETYLTNHTDALNLALEQVKHYTIQMDSYHDVADYEAYRDLVAR